MPETAYQYLKSHELLTIATASKSAVPHATPVFYVSDGPVVLFSCSDESQTGQNLAENAYAAVAVADAPDPGQDWSDARGLQIWGPVTRLEGADAEAAADAFRNAYPHLGDHVTGSPFYRLEPEEVHYIHNDESGDEDFEALGVHWIRETVED
jgi:uncharacterized protein YhbP (UPF0306 family)